MTGFGRMAMRWTAAATLALPAGIGALPSASAAEDYLTGSPGILCETPAKIAEMLMAENNPRALDRVRGCRVIDNGSPVRILSRDNAVAKVTVGTGSNAATGYMPVQSITNARGDPID